MRPAVHRVHRHCSITVASLSLATQIAVPEAWCLWTPVGRRCLDQVLDATNPATPAPAVVAGFTLRSALVTSERSGLVTRAASAEGTRPLDGISGCCRDDLFLQWRPRHDFKPRPLRKKWQARSGPRNARSSHTTAGPSCKPEPFCAHTLTTGDKPDLPAAAPVIPGHFHKPCGVSRFIQRR